MNIEALKKDNGTVLNIDNDALYHFMRRRDFKVDPAELENEVIKHFNERYLNAGLSDILYNIDGCTPCKTREFQGDKYLCKEERGVAVDYSENKKLRAAYDIYAKTDVDAFGIWIELCRKNGINPWLSFRMNDVHYANAPTGHSEFGYTAREKGWIIGNEASYRWDFVGASAPWYAYALDYSVSEVRAYFTDYIDELLGKYDVYGIELDWQRVIWCFKRDSADNCKYMNELMQAVNDIVAKYEKQYGHKIKIMARINRDIDENLLFGFDVRYWIKKDWIDVIVASPYWGNTDSDMPIAKWKKELEGTGVELYACLEMHTTHWKYMQNYETVAAQSAMYLSAGADKIYMFNFMEWEPDYWLTCSSMYHAFSRDKRRYFVTHSNCCPEGMERYIPLPIELSADKTGEITLNHGLLDTDGETVLYVGADKADAVPDVTFNGVALQCLGESDGSYFGADNKPYPIFAYKVPADALNGKAQMKFKCSTENVLRYVELMNANA